MKKVLIKEYISLINHASIFIETNDKKNILSDPWYEGEIFNNGWRLIYKNKDKQIKDLLSKTKFIYLSHEHPDHFSVNFFYKYIKYLKQNRIKILFQETSDKRLENFLKEKFDLKFQILKNSFTQKSKKRILSLYKNNYIDSSLIYESKNFYHINFNDCNFQDYEINFIKKKLVNKKKKKILYIQFSYAAHRSDDKWLKNAALYKLKNIFHIYKLLNIDLVIPFASFINFSNIENQNLNKFKNNCYNTSLYFKKHKVNYCFLNPLNTKINLDELINNKNFRKKTNNNSISFWDNKFSKKNKNFTPSLKKEISNNTANKFLERVKKKNSILLMHLIRFFSFKFLFGDCIIYLTDTKETYKINFFSIRKIQDKSKASLSMKSEVLFFMLEEVYGVDTIIVNGRFKEIKKNSFSKLIQSIGFTIINQSNHGINLNTLLNKFFLKKLFFALKNVMSKQS